MSGIQQHLVELHAQIKLRGELVPRPLEELQGATVQHRVMTSQLVAPLAPHLQVKEVVEEV